MYLESVGNYLSYNVSTLQCDVNSGSGEVTFTAVFYSSADPKVGLELIYMKCVTKNKTISYAYIYMCHM